jgi:S-formylglutathione hydrolase FrmB
MPAAPAPSAAEGRVECKAVASATMRRDVRYCAILPPSYDSPDAKARQYPVLYFLHGLGDNEQSLVNFGGWNLLENLQDTQRIGEYIVVTPDGGRGFYVNSKDARNRYEDFFIREFLPAIEKRYRIRAVRAARGIGGFSMGGYGALRFAFKYPHLFASVSAHSAALYEALPRAVANSPRMQSRLAMLTGVFGSPLDAAFFEQQNPLTLARQAASGPRAAALRRLRIYFDCGDRDDYGFDAGAKALHDLLAAQRVEHEYHLYPGAHTPFYFLEHLPASFEFHSKAFGLDTVK